MQFEKDNREHFSLPWLKKMLGELNQVRDCFAGDFSPLLSFTLAEDAWAAWQFDRPDLGTGAVLVFRRPKSPFVEASLRLQGLEPEAVYESLDADSGAVVTAAGKEWMEEGLRVEIPNKPAAKLFMYKKL